MYIEKANPKFAQGVQKLHKAAKKFFFRSFRNSSLQKSSEGPKVSVESAFSHLIQLQHQKDRKIKFGDILYISFEQYQLNQKKKCVVYGEETNGSYLKWVKEGSSKKLNQEQFLFRVTENLHHLKQSQNKDYNLEEVLNQDLNSQETQDEQTALQNNTFIVYGQTILLQHIYSGSYLSVDLEQMNIQQNSLRVVLKNKVSSNCFLKILPSNGLNTLGQKIFYSHIVFLSGNREKDVFLKMSQYRS